MGKNLSVIIVPHDNAKTLNFRFSYRLLYTFSALLAILVLVVFVFVITYGRVLMTAEHVRRLGRENEKLKLEAAQIDSLKMELLNLQALSIQVKGMLGVDLSPDDSLLVAKFSPSARVPAHAPEELDEVVGATEQQLLLEALPSLWPVRGYMTKGFFITGGEKSADYHPGIDIAGKRDTPVRAAGEGVVVTSGFDDTYGFVVEIDHGFGIYTLYGHNSRNLVKVGDRVTRGSTIAFLGTTGKSTAPHLHFEVRKNGIPVDPREYLLDF
jgi:murein DD-endopeptidase MepM/ murein hydrolase activator NlpD